MAEGKGKGRKVGRNKEKCKRYSAQQTREKNKIKRVLKSSGAVAAEAYAKRYNMAGYLSKIKKG